MKRLCIEPGCGLLTSKTRCLRHARSADARRQARRGDRYKGDHPKLARATIAEQPWCTWCGATTDLTADHYEFGLRTLCRSCNSARANRGRAVRQAGTSR